MKPGNATGWLVRPTGMGLLLGAWCSLCEACLWFHGTDLQGFRVEVEGGDPQMYLEQLAPERTLADWKEARERFETRSGTGGDFKTRSDRAAFLIYKT
jgi:hypothetical protein